jgi:hypothetical protein
VDQVAVVLAEIQLQAVHQLLHKVLLVEQVQVLHLLLTRIAEQVEVALVQLALEAELLVQVEQVEMEYQTLIVDQQ